MSYEGKVNLMLAWVYTGMLQGIFVYFFIADLQNIFFLSLERFIIGHIRHAFFFFDLCMKKSYVSYT